MWLAAWRWVPSPSAASMLQGTPSNTGVSARSVKLGRRTSDPSAIANAFLTATAPATAPGRGSSRTCQRGSTHPGRTPARIAPARPAPHPPPSFPISRSRVVGTRTVLACARVGAMGSRRRSGQASTASRLQDRAGRWVTVHWPPPSILNASLRPSLRWNASVNQSCVRESTRSKASTPPSQTGRSPTSAIRRSATSFALPSSAA